MRSFHISFILRSLPCFARSSSSFEQVMYIHSIDHLAQLKHGFWPLICIKFVTYFYSSHTATHTDRVGLVWVFRALKVGAKTRKIESVMK
jgi:uncharacterized membrane protein YbaN (DUF454 family)